AGLTGRRHDDHGGLARRGGLLGPGLHLGLRLGLGLRRFLVGHLGHDEALTPGDGRRWGSGPAGTLGPVTGRWKSERDIVVVFGIDGWRGWASARRPGRGGVVAAPGGAVARRPGLGCRRSTRGRVAGGGCGIIVVAT